MYKEKIYDVETGQTTWRDFTPEEIAEVEKNQAIADAEQLALAEAAAKKAAAEAKLEALGLTADDLKALGF
jgi:hypothetical protein